MNMRSCRFTGVLLATTLLACTEAQEMVAPVQLARLDAAAYELVDLGAFDGAFTQALALDKHGTTYGRYGTASNLRSFRWTKKAGYEDLGHDAVDNGAADCDSDAVADPNRISGQGKVVRGLSAGAIMQTSRNAGELY